MFYNGIMQNIKSSLWGAAMNPIYEKLFSTYGDSILSETGSYNEDEITAALAKLPLDQSTTVSVCNLFFEHYCRWSVDAFSLGLHLGLSLLCDDIRRARPQQVQ